MVTVLVAATGNTQHQEDVMECLMVMVARVCMFLVKELTLEYARMLGKVGARILTLHGKIREQRRSLTCLAYWENIWKVK